MFITEVYEQIFKKKQQKKNKKNQKKTHYN